MIEAAVEGVGVPLSSFALIQLLPKLDFPLWKVYCCCNFGVVVGELPRCVVVVTSFSS